MQGLSGAEVEKRMNEGKQNLPVDSATKTVKEIIRSNIFTYFNLIFLLIAVLLIMVGSYRDLTFLPIIAANTMIGIVQEIRSKKTLDELAILHAPHTKCIRDGEELILDAVNLVQDDIVIFEAGNQVPADAVILNGTVKVNEALLTGESDDVERKKGDELLSGSFVVSGSCVCRLTKVGAESYISRLTLQATQSKSEEQSEMIRSLNRLVKVVGIAIIPIGILLFSQQYFYMDAPFRSSVTRMVAAVLGMIPEGLYLLASVALAVSVMRLARQKVLVHDMKCIEALARTDVLCVDKTGTITENKMRVYKLVTVRGQEEAGRTALLLGDFVAAQACDNQTMEALKAAYKENNGRKATKVISFSSVYKYSAACFGEEAFVLGAPEFVLGERFAQYEQMVNNFSARGYRVVVFCKYDGVMDGEKLTGEVNPLGFVLLSNPIRKGAKETFSYFEKQGVEVKVISGDNPVTCAHVAKLAGIAGAERYVDARTLSSSSDYEYAVRNYTVFGRVAPEQKRELVRALKAVGKTVAMTGDGVNDVLALKDADCSVAMASGAEAASQVAQLVLMESDFSKMPSVVLEGRRVVNNVERSASLFLVKNIFSVLLSLLSVLFLLDYPLEPAQVSLIGLFTIGTPSFVLALESNREKIKGHFMMNVMRKAVPAGLTDFIIVTGFGIVCREFGLYGNEVSTCCCILIGVVGFMVLYNISCPMNRLHWILLGTMFFGWLFCLFYLKQLFAITQISKRCGMLLVLFLMIAEPVFRYLQLLTNKLYQIFDRRN